MTPFNMKFSINKKPCCVWLCFTLHNMKLYYTCNGYITLEKNSNTVTFYP